MELLSNVIQYALNQYLKLDPEVPKQLAKFSGKTVKVEFNGLPLYLYFHFEATEIRVAKQYSQQADTIIRGTPLALLGLGLSTGVQKAKHLFSGDVEIKGDVELGQELQKILDNMDIDWEEHLAVITGDVIAHQVGNVVRSTVNWGQESKQAMQKNLTDYLQEEINLMPTREALDDFFQEVDQLRHATDRIEVRVSKLQRLTSN